MRYLFLIAFNCTALLFFSLTSSAQTHGTTTKPQPAVNETGNPVIQPSVPAPHATERKEETGKKEDELPKIPETKAESTAPAEEKQITVPSPPKNNKEIS